MLLVSKNERNRYCWIKNKSRLFSSQACGHKSVRDFCDQCIRHFANKLALGKHLEYCSNREEVRT